MMREIGGYFELEEKGTGVFPHSSAVLLNTGRNAFEYILRALPRVDHIWLPYYTCEAVLEPISKLGISYSFYNIDSSLEISEPDNISLDENDYLVVNNYFGVKDSYINDLKRRFGPKMIVDDTQAFYCKTDESIASFYSCRKFFGVPDGGVAYCEAAAELYDSLEQDDSSERMRHLFERKNYGARRGYASFKANEERLCRQPIRRMSPQTREILSNIDYEAAKQRRIANYRLLDAYLGGLNMLRLPDMSSFSCPMVYPFLSERADLKKELISNKIFVATYWPDVCRRISDSFENFLEDRLLALPCDQRYSEEDMKCILDIINN